MMKKQIWRCMAGMTALCMGISGCGALERESHGEQGDGYRSFVKAEEPGTTSYSDYEFHRELLEENPVSEEFIRAVDDFSWKTASEILREGSGNRNYSPLSLYYALAIAAQGSEGRTKEEFLELLGMEDQKVLAEECGRLFRRLYTDNECGSLKPANSLWLRDGFDVKQKFLDTARKDYYASVFGVDFTNPETGNIMGAWVAEQTGGLLAPVFQANPDEVLAIINTLYLQDEWYHPFSESGNTEDVFVMESGEEMICEYMHADFFHQAYYQGEGYTGTALGLKNSGSMILILPEEGQEVRSLLAEEKLAEIFEKPEGGSARVKISLPKFNFDDSMELNGVLQRLGISDAFDMDVADFSALTKEPLIYVSRVKQESHIGIHEKGVEAAAYTILEMEAGAAFAEEPEIYEINFSRPFLFGIISDSGVPLFMGICERPTEVE